MFKPMSGNNNRICPQCREEFACGITNGEEKCWCFQYPNVIPNVDITEGGQTCLCPDCLRAKILRQAIHMLDIHDDFDDERWSN